MGKVTTNRCFPKQGKHAIMNYTSKRGKYNTQKEKNIMKKFSRTCYYVVATMGKVEMQNGEYKVIPMDTLKFEDVKQAQRYASKNMLTVLNLEEKCELRSIDILKYIELSDYEKDVEKEEE